jgi:hypothetical protein
MAFVATAERREACADVLTAHRLIVHLSGAGLFAMEAGDLATAWDCLSMDAGECRVAVDGRDRAIGLLNLSACLGHLGETGPARAEATEALAAAKRAGEQRLPAIIGARACLAWLADLNGDTAEAEEQFIAADRSGFADPSDGTHLDGVPGAFWAGWLIRTGRPRPARVLAERNRESSRVRGRNDNVARSDRVLGRLALAAGQAAFAGEHLAAAAECFRDGEYLIELATTLVDLAECARMAGDLDAADSHAAEALAIAAPRSLVPVQSAALAARARICAGRAAAASDPDRLARGRDAADAALRLATRRHRLPWAELDALRAHAALDQAEGTDRGWAAQAGALHAELVPAGLDPDPLATVERLAAADRAAREAHPEEDR